jgi:hypothetical protein
MFRQEQSLLYMQYPFNVGSYFPSYIESQQPEIHALLYGGLVAFNKA